MNTIENSLQYNNDDEFIIKLMTLTRSGIIDWHTEVQDGLYFFIGQVFCEEGSGLLDVYVYKTQMVLDRLYLIQNKDLIEILNGEIKNYLINEISLKMKNIKI